MKKIRKTPAAKQLVTKPHLRSWRRKVASYNRAAKKAWKAALAELKLEMEADGDQVKLSPGDFAAQAARRAIPGVLTASPKV